MSTIAEEKILQMAAEPFVDNDIHDSLLGRVDDGSSSGLSDPDDRTGNEVGDDAPDPEEDGSDAYDTEAETERIEETPRNQRNVLLTPSNGTLPDYEDLRVGDQQRAEAPQQASDSSLEETGEEDEALSSSFPSKKRKRSAFISNNREARDARRHKTANVSKPSRSRSCNISSNSQTPVAEDQNQLETSTVEPTLKQNHNKGKRKGRKVKEYEAPSKVERAFPHETPHEATDQGEAVSSNDEDVEMEDAVEREGADADSAAKTEEDLAKKKTAMHALSAIENCFATLRDKLFDERLAQCNEELAMLEQPTFIHPELLLMKEVIDRRRNQKIKYEQTLLKFKLESLQRESIANKAQMHSQYMQAAGELRDTYLSRINAEIYQTQRERRSCEADIPDYLYIFNTKRSKQITGQTAYNEEVSLLSGVAKYAGFPAAPAIIEARSNEWEEDHRTYKHRVAIEDEANNARRASQQHPPILRASLSAASTFGRPQPTAEDKFLQQNAWANPQHPAHQKHRQVSAFSQATTPSATPANQIRVIETGSASTIPDNPSALDSSIALTPAPEEVSRDAQNDRNAAVFPGLADMTQSRAVVTEESSAIIAQPAVRSLIAPPSEAEPNPHPSSSTKIPERESHTPGALPKPLPFMQSEGTLRASPPIRNPVIKAEDSSTIYRHSPVAQQPQGSPLVSTAANGHIHRSST